MKTSEQINELAAALCKAQSQMVAAKKTEKNPYFKSSYADLANVIANDRKVLTDNGLCVVQGLSMYRDDSGIMVAVITRLIHTSGQWIEETAGASTKDLLPQTVGGACTYLRRYGYQAMVGSTAEGDDDDGEKAQGRDVPAEVKYAKVPAPTTPNEKNAKNPIDETLDGLRKRFDALKNSGYFTQPEMSKMNAEVSKVKNEMPSIEFLIGGWELDLKDKVAHQKESMDKIFEANV